MSEKVLVTGAAGFIGSHLVEMLVQEGFDVRAMVHYNAKNDWHNLEFIDKEIYSSIEVFSGDIVDPYAVRTAVKGCSRVFHLAALIGIPYSYIAPASYVATNVTGTLNVLEACRAEGVERLMHTSTSETYGTAQYVPIDEKHPLVGQSPYSASKIAADKLAQSYWLSYDLPVVTVRPFNTYGPRQSMRAIIPTIVVQALTRDKIELGNLDPIRDLTYVTDTARGFLAASAAEAPEVLGETLNLGVGKGVSIGELASMALEITGLDKPICQSDIRTRPPGSEVERLISDNAKARLLTSWNPEVSLRTGLNSVVEFVRDHLELYKSSIYNV